jgi:hypothetical protein
LNARIWPLFLVLALLAGCNASSRHDDRAAATVQLAELHLLASNAADHLLCAKYKAVADDDKISAISSKRARYALFAYYRCLQGSASKRKQRSDEIGEAPQSDAVKAESVRVSAAALRDANLYARQAGLLHIPITL